MTDTVLDLIGQSYTQKPLEFRDTFNALMSQKISDAVENRKYEIAQTMFNYEEPETDTTEE